MVLDPHAENWPSAGTAEAIAVATTCKVPSKAVEGFGLDGPGFLIIQIEDRGPNWRQKIDCLKGEIRRRRTLIGIDWDHTGWWPADNGFSNNSFQTLALGGFYLLFGMLIFGKVRGMTRPGLARLLAIGGVFVTAIFGFLLAVFTGAATYGSPPAILLPFPICLLLALLSVSVSGLRWVWHSFGRYRRGASR